MNDLHNINTAYICCSSVQCEILSTAMCQRDDEAIVRRLRPTSASQLEYIATMQKEIESRNLRLYVANRVLKTRDQENCGLTKELAQQREEHLEARIELQEVKSDLASYESYVVELKREVMKEKETHHAFRDQLCEAQRELASIGRHVKDPVDEIDMRLEQLKNITANEGENSSLYKRKRKLLDNVLHPRQKMALIMPESAQI